MTSRVGCGADAPAISVVVPVYNVESYLNWCLESLSGQTFENIEILCVNDGSTDSSLEILRAWRESDARIRIIDKENGGLSSARNAGIREAAAEVVCFLDSDDRFTPNACERIAKAFYGEGGRSVDVVTFGANCYPEEASYPWLERCLSPRDAEYAPFHPDLIFKEMSRPFAWRTAGRTSFLRENGLYFDESVKFGEDQVFHFAVYPRASRTVLMSDKLYDYRVSREGSLMHRMNADPFAKMAEHLKITAAILRDWGSAGYLERYSAEMVEWVVEFVLLGIVGLPSGQREALVAEGASMLRPFTETLLGKGGVRRGAAARILEEVASGRALSDGASKRLRLAYHVEKDGVLAVVRRVVSRKG